MTATIKFSCTGGWWSASIKTLTWGASVSDYSTREAALEGLLKEVAGIACEEHARAEEWRRRCGGTP